MDLSFEEKSAWGSLLSISVASWLFFPVAIAHIQAGGEPVDLLFRALFVVGVVIAIEVVFHSATTMPKDREADERDAMIGLKADRYAGYVLAIGVALIIGQIVLRDAVPYAPQQQPIVLVAIYLMLAMTVSEASKPIAQIWFYRVGS